MLFAIAFTLSAPFTASAQDETERRGKREQAPAMSAEERKAALSQRIERSVTQYLEEMGEHAPREDQLQSFTEILGSAEIERAKIMQEMRALREKQSGRPDREAMTAIRSKVDKIDTQVTKEMKKLLEKDQFKAFKKAKEKLTPQARGQRGGGGGGMRGGAGGGQRGGGF